MQIYLIQELHVKEQTQAVQGGASESKSRHRDWCYTTRSVYSACWLMMIINPAQMMLCANKGTRWSKEARLIVL